MKKETKVVEEIPEMIEKETKKIGKEIDKEFVAQIVIIAVLALLLVYNFGKLSGGGGGAIGTVSASEIIPTGMPEIYGKELGISYDDISPSDPRKADASIGVLADLDTSITLTGDDLQRYIIIGLQISCEYCCGAESIIFSNGQAA